MRVNDLPKFYDLRSADNNRIIAVSNSKMILIQCSDKDDKYIPMALYKEQAIQLRDFLNEFIEANNE